MDDLGSSCCTLTLVVTKVLCMQVVGLMQSMLVILHPIDSLWFLRILNNLSSCIEVSVVEVMTDRVLDSPRNTYLKYLGKDFSFNFGGWTIDGMFAFTSEFNVSKGFIWLLSLAILACAFNKHTMSTSFSSSSSRSLEIKFCSRGFDDILFSCISSIAPWMTLTAKQSPVSSEYLLLRRW